LAIESALFTVCLESSCPESTTERVQTFFFDDNRNKWLDKLLSFIVAANGASAMFCEHAKLDMPPLRGLLEAVSKATKTSTNTSRYSETQGKEELRGYFKFLPTSIPAELGLHIESVRERFYAQVTGFALTKYSYTGYGAAALKSRNLSPKATVAVILQVALRRFCGYSPPVCNTLSQYHFKGGRVDLMAATTPAMVEFCDACLDPRMDVGEKRRLLAEAARSYGQLAALLRWAKGWTRHLFGLSEMVKADEEMPGLFKDPVYLRVRPGKAFFTFQKAPGPEMGSTRPVRDGFWISVDVGETQ
jgi:carnitine O-acetyltransferase